MKFELTKEFLDNLVSYIDEDQDKKVLELLSGLHHADIAEIIHELNNSQAKFVFLLLDGETASDVLMQLDDDDRNHFLEKLPSEIIVRQFIEYMDSDDAADVIGELSLEKKDDVLDCLNDIKHASNIVDLLGYDEDTAGGLMAKEMVKVNENWSVQTCLKEISRQAEDIDEIYYVYVVDDQDVMKGVLSLKRLIMNPTHKNITEIYNPDIIYVKTEEDAEEVAKTMEKYDLVAIPVVDSIGRLKGRITIDDVVHLIREEAEKDFQLATGISEDVESDDNINLQVRARLPWLLVGLIGGVLGSRLIGSFSDELATYPMMATFIPMIGAMGGNVGVQSSSIMVQSLATQRSFSGSFVGSLAKEVAVALINGAVLSSLVFAYNFFFSDSYALTITVSIAMVTVILCASLFGTIIPLILNRMKIDPATATGPFITTLNDIMGMLIYFSVGRILFSFFAV